MGEVFGWDMARVRSYFIICLACFIVVVLLTGCSRATAPDEAVAVEQDPVSEETQESEATSTSTTEPEATPTPAPTPAPTPEPSPTIEPTATLEPTSIPEPEAMCPERGDAQWIYATNSAGHRVHVFNMDGAEVCSWGERGSDPGHFESPHGITTHPDGNVYVADEGFGRVQVFSDRGAYLDEWSSEHDRSHVSLVAVSPSGSYLYTIDRLFGRLEVIDLASMESVGELEHEVVELTRALNPWESDTAALALPGGLFIVEPSADNQILFAPAEGVLPSGAIQVGGGHSLIVLDVSAQPITTIAVMNEAGETTDFLLDDVGNNVLFSYNDQIGLALGRDGQLVISERSANTIGILSIDVLPTASVVTLWQLESDDPDVEIDVRLIALSP